MNALILTEQPLDAQGATPHHVRGYVEGLEQNAVAVTQITAGYLAWNPVLRAAYACRRFKLIDDLRTDRITRRIIWSDLRQSRPTRRELQKLRHQQFDIVILGSLGSAARSIDSVKRLWPDARLVYAAQNVEGDLIKTLAESRGYSQWIMNRVKVLEDSVSNVVDAIWATGAEDLATFEHLYPDTVVSDVPQAVAVEGLVAPTGMGEQVAFTFGTWEYPPNWAGLLAITSVQGASGTLVVYGKVSSQLQELVMSSKPDTLSVEFAGFRDELDSIFIEATGPMIVPVWDGGGVKTRTTQAAARGVPVVGPPEAARGLPRWIAERLIIREDPKSVLEAAWQVDSNDWESAANLRDSLLAKYNWRVLVGEALADLTTNTAQ